MITDSILQIGTGIWVLYIWGMKKNISYILLHVGIWILIVAMPVYYTSRSFSVENSDALLFIPLPFWITIGLLIIIFYLNYHVFIPRFLFAKMYVVYVLILAGLFLIFMEAPRFIADLVGQPRQTPRMDREIAERVFPVLFSNVFLMYVTVFFSSIALRMSNRWQKTEEERLNAQLSYLTSQVNPHFLFNTLNSIYGLTIVEAPKAADMVSKLSEMMRYTLDSSRNDFVPLNEELEYLKGYIELQKVRMDENISLEVSINQDDGTNKIAPLILLPFIENAFKYGVNAEQNSNIKIHIKTEGKKLNLTVFNNKVDVDSQHLKKTGFGIENTKRRLELIYPDKYELQLKENEYEFTVKLNLFLL
ncbi:MAG: sensor histidine kinase [Balneolaceae bacterium]|nr:sensor histidine kinase [Balneolaceae bacterium]